MASNLPTVNETGSLDTKQFFDKFFINEISFPANEIDASVGFFLKRGFLLFSPAARWDAILTIYYNIL